MKSVSRRGRRGEERGQNTAQDHAFVENTEPAAKLSLPLAFTANNVSPRSGQTNNSNGNLNAR